jgi:dTDP-glucose 4,6-dehydratase
MSRLAIVTGGFGFLGSYVCEALSAAGWDFVVIDSLRPEAVNEEFVSGLRGYTPGSAGDVADPGTWERAARFLFRGEKVDAVFHLAAETHVDRSLGLDPTTLAPLAADPVERLYRTNVIGTARAAEFARSVGAHLIHWSTDEVYGDCVRLPAQLRAGGPATVADCVMRRMEEAPCVPSSPYAASKVAAEAVVHSWVRLGLRAAILRPSNAYGARQARDKLIPVAIGHLARGEPVPLYDGGWQVRQWIHAEDIVRAALKAVDLQAEGTWNIGGPSLLQNNRLVGILAHPNAFRTKPVPDRPGHDAAYAISSARAERDLGWKPARSIEQDAAAIFAAYASVP